MKLYKYLPSKYLEDTVIRGNILFRNLSYFKKVEAEERGDVFEGIHRDNPDNHVQITNMHDGKSVLGDFSFLNEINSNDVYIFCLSQDYSPDLYDKFNSDACVEITDIDLFIKRLRKQLIPKLSTNKKAGVLHGEVNYYYPNKPAEFNVKDPLKLPFAKDINFKHQNEYRIVFGKGKSAFDLKQSIVINGRYDFKEEADKGIDKKLFIPIGDISDISIVHSK